MAYDKIIFQKKINDSVQKGDELWYSDISSGTPTPPQQVGTINFVGEKEIRVNAGLAPTGTVSYVELVQNGGFNPSISLSLIGEKCISLSMPSIS